MKAAYYALARETRTHFGILRVTKEAGKPLQQEFTGERYERLRDAERAVLRLNASLFGRRPAF